MNARSLLSKFLLAACAAGVATASNAADRVGVYDSRLVAYADFLRAEHQEALKRRMAEGRAAKERGDTARCQEIEKEMKKAQQALHLQVFSTAPIPDAMARLQAKLPALARETGVRRFVSKWDEDALRDVAEADRVDVTDLLVRDYALTEKQRETMRQIGAKEPVPLWKARLAAWLRK